MRSRSWSLLPSSLSRPLLVVDLGLFRAILLSFIASVACCSVLALHLLVCPLVVIHLILDARLDMLILPSRLNCGSFSGVPGHISRGTSSLRSGPARCELRHLPPLAISV